MTSDSKKTPLVGANSPPPLYDASSMLELDSQLAQGYEILLTGANEQSGKTGPSQQTVTLGFSALTQGNVVDACFGMLQSKQAQGLKKVKEAKSILAVAAADNSHIPRIAVTAYAKAFQVVLSFRSELNNLNFFTKCFKYGSIQRAAVEALQEAFAPLSEAVEAAL